MMLEQDPNPREGAIMPSAMNGTVATASLISICRHQCFVYLDFNIPVPCSVFNTPDRFNMIHCPLYDGDNNNSNNNRKF